MELTSKFFADFFEKAKQGGSYLDEQTGSPANHHQGFTHTTCIANSVSEFNEVTIAASDDTLQANISLEFLDFCTQN